MSSLSLVTSKKFVHIFSFSSEHFGRPLTFLADLRALDAHVLFPRRLVLRNLVDPQEHAGSLAYRVRASEREVELGRRKEKLVSKAAHSFSPKYHSLRKGNGNSPTTRMKRALCYSLHCTASG